MLRNPTGSGRILTFHLIDCIIFRAYASRNGWAGPHGRCSRIPSSLCVCQDGLSPKHGSVLYRLFPNELQYPALVAKLRLSCLPVQNRR